jgi:hypothetical protein
MPTIVFHDPRRPEKAAMTLTAGEVNAAATVEQLRRRGFVVDKITYADPPSVPGRRRRALA